MDESFRAEAECRKRDIPVEVFIHEPEDPRHEQLVRQAKDVCRTCPVQADCFLFGMQNGETGVWGGSWLDVPPETPSDKP